MSKVFGAKKGGDELASKGKPFRWYMGYDSHEDIAFEVAKYSLMRRSSIPVEVIPLKRREFVKRGIYTRSQDPKQSTEFTYLRFLVPYLNNYTGMITQIRLPFSVFVES